MYIIDRIEGSCAIAEHGGEMLRISLDALPKGVGEGDVLRKNGDLWELDSAGTQARRESLAARRRRMLSGGKP